MPDPLEEIVLFPSRNREEQLRHQEVRNAQMHKQRRAQIKHILRRLGTCCRGAQFRWPEKRDLERLHILVTELPRRTRKPPTLPLWKAYKAADNYWNLGLWQTLSDLVERAARDAPPRPLEDYDKALTKKSLSEVAAKLFQCYNEVSHGRDPASIEWEQFTDLFKSVRQPSVSSSVPLRSGLGECGGKPTLVAYTVFLELFCSDTQWVRKHWRGAQVLTRWVIAVLQNPKMVRTLRRFLIPADIGNLLVEDTEQLPEQLAKKKKDAKRAKDRERKRRK
jgi:hypothetical protein